MQHKKILYIVNVDWYFNLHWLSRMKASQQAGYQVFLACHFSDADIMQELQDAGVNCYPLRLARTSLNPAGELRSILQIRRLVRRIQPDLVHTITVKANIYGGLAATAQAIPLVSTVAGRGWTFSDGGIKASLVNRFVNHLYRRIFRHANTRIIFENPDDRDYFVQQSLLEKAQSQVILGAGVDLAHFELAASDMMQDNCLLFASRMLKSKGLDTLVAACDLLRARGRQIRLCVAGILDESQADALPLQQIEQWAGSGKLEWLGQRKDMAKLIGESILVALPTRYGEGIPRVLIEAAACGRALIATDVSGCREIVRHGQNGILVSPEAGIEAWAEAIDDLIDDRHKAVEMGLAGRRLVEVDFSDSKICAETLALYADVIQRK